MVCGECTHDLPPSAFYTSNRATCKGCVKARQAARRRADPSAHRRYAARWRERERQRGELLEHVLRMVAARFPTAFHEAVLDAEDSLGLDPGTALDLFSRKQRDF